MPFEEGENTMTPTWNIALAISGSSPKKLALLLENINFFFQDFEIILLELREHGMLLQVFRTEDEDWEQRFTQLFDGLQAMGMINAWSYKDSEIEVVD